MAIFAQKSGGGTGQSGSLRVQVGREIQNGSVLVWDSAVGAFVDSIASGTAITSAKALGGLGGVNVLKGRSGSTLEFRDLRAGPGISLGQDGTSIIVTSDATGGSPVVADSYRIVIDSDDSSDDEARFELFTVRAAAEKTGVATATLPVLTSSAVFTGNTHTGRGYFQTQNDADLDAHGFRAGMWVRIDNALNQSGTFRVTDVLTQNLSGVALSTLVIDRLFHDAAAFNMGGPKPDVRFEQIDVVIATDDDLSAPHDPDLAYRISSFSIDFGPDGIDFRPGVAVEVTGTADQDGSYLIGAVEPRDATGYSSLVMDAATPFLGTVGPQAGRISFRVQQAEVDTGFSVSERGHLRSTTGTFADGLSVSDPTYRPVEPGDVVTKASLDQATARRPLRYFFANL